MEIIYAYGRLRAGESGVPSAFTYSTVLDLMLHCNTADKCATIIKENVTNLSVSAGGAKAQMALVCCRVCVFHHSW